MNKKELILSEAKRLSGMYGYLGFTLKQLAQACDMTAPALYYFYTSKAELFKDCLLSEIEARHRSISQYAGASQTFTAFVTALMADSFDKCGSSHFRTGQAMMEVVHLPQPLQDELRAAWERLMIAPIEEFLARVMPSELSEQERNMLGTFLINMATFAAYHEERYGREALTAMMIAAGNGLPNFDGVRL